MLYKQFAVKSKKQQPLNKKFHLILKRNSISSEFLLKLICWVVFTICNLNNHYIDHILFFLLLDTEK